MNKLFRYQGSKSNLKYFIPINNYLTKIDSNIYVEPFVGSGGILFNLSRSFEKYIINDISYGVIRIFKTFNEIDFEYYIEKLKFIDKEFGNIKTNKESYYNFRNFFNQNFYQTNSIDEGIYLMFLYNSCINSMARFGPNGFNQGFGRCGYHYNYTKENHINIQNILKKTEIYNLDAFEFLNNLSNETILNSVIFIDPPYFKMNSSYKSLSDKEFNQLIEFMKNTSARIIYTDSEHSYLDNTKFKQQLIREMRSTAPSSKNNKTRNEMIWSNIK